MCVELTLVTRVNYEKEKKKGWRSSGHIIINSLCFQNDTFSFGYKMESGVLNKI